jgi:hypothetical protein
MIHFGTVLPRARGTRGTRDYLRWTQKRKPHGSLFFFIIIFLIAAHARAPCVPRVRGSAVPEFIISGLKIDARANFKSSDLAQLHRIEGSRAEFYIASLRVPIRRCAEIPGRAMGRALVYTTIIMVVLYSGRLLTMGTEPFRQLDALSLSSQEYRVLAL